MGISDSCMFVCLAFFMTCRILIMSVHETYCIVDTFINIAYLPTIPDSPELLRKSASNYGITARGKIITDILYYRNLVTLGNNR